MGMVDITEKPIILRMAEAAGKILLSTHTIKEINNGRIKKGDPLIVAEVAGINAAKQTHLLIPHCHQIPLDTVTVGSFIDLPVAAQQAGADTIAGTLTIAAEYIGMGGVEFTDELADDEVDVPASHSVSQ